MPKKTTKTPVEGKKGKKIKKLYAHVVLDRSGSMEVIRDKTIDAINEYINGLGMDRALDARVSLTLFDEAPLEQEGITETVIDAVKAKDAPRLNRDTYEPRGTTPLNDAIGKVVTKIDGTSLRDGENVALVILTDGKENASKEYSKEAVRALLASRQKDKNWLVIYLGANQDAFAEGAKYGSARVNTMTFDPQQMGKTMESTLRATRAYGLTGLSTSAAFTDAERLSAMVGKAIKPKNKSTRA